MNCLINLLALCVFDPSQVYVRADLDFALNRPQAKTNDGEFNEGYWCKDRWCSGPRAVIRLGAKIELNDFTLDYGLAHSSFLAEDDRGQESAYVGVTWRPWR